MLKWWNANQKKIEAHDAIIDDRDRLLQEVNTLRADKRVLQQKLDDMNEEQRAIVYFLPWTLLVDFPR